MYDPSTVAFEIKYPWVKHRTVLKNGHVSVYREDFITIWHVDPEKTGRGNRTDDSCGWFRPPTTEAEREAVRKAGLGLYGTIFGKQVAIAEGASYASVCYEPSAYDAIYWTWRHIKHEHRKRGVWMFGDGSRFLTPGELDEIYSLSSNPIDNFRVTVSEIKDGEKFASFYLSIYRLYQRFNRPWYRHPRWHVWHWRIQIRPLQKLNRWLFDRCAFCGRGFKWNEQVIGSWSGKKIWHGRCDHHTHVKHEVAA